MSGRRRSWGRLLASVAGMVLVAATLMAFDRSAGRPAAPREASVEPWRGDYIPNPWLTTHDGRRVRFYDDLVKGKRVAINTFFTVCTDVCPLGTAKMLALQQQLGERVGRDIHFYSLSVDPIGDTPASMREYANRYGVGPGWTFLSGRPEDIAEITRKLGLGVVRETDPRESHSTTLMVGDESSGRWMKHSATDNPQFVAASIATFLGWTIDDTRQHQADARTLAITHGEFLFRNACSACHGIGDGDRLGPDLLGVHERRPRAWLEAFVQAPDRLIAAGDPTSTELLARYRGLRMPNLDLSPEDVREVLGYIEARSQRHRSARAAPASGH